MDGRSSPPAQPPLADRVEQFIAGQLETGPVAAAARWLEAAYAAFPGWQTPDAALLAACLESYSQPGGELLRLRDEDAAPAAQRRPGRHAAPAGRAWASGWAIPVWLAPEPAQLARPELPPGRRARSGWPGRLDAGQRGLARGKASRPLPLPWWPRRSLHPWLAAPSEALAACPRYVALPGGRAGLLDFKLRRCPPWRSRLAWTGWEFVKFRHLRELAGQPGLSLAGFRARIGLDPIVTLPGQQLTLFEHWNDKETPMRLTRCRACRWRTCRRRWSRCRACGPPCRPKTPARPVPALLVKRDDQTGLASGGNKTRKLEYLLAEALAAGGRHGADRGRAAVQPLPPDGRGRGQGWPALRAGAGRQRAALEGGNLLLDRLLGAEIVWAGQRDRLALLAETAEAAGAAGHRPYIIPYGGSSPSARPATRWLSRS